MTSQNLKLNEISLLLRFGRVCFTSVMAKLTNIETGYQRSEVVSTTVCDHEVREVLKLVYGNSSKRFGDSC